MDDLARLKRRRTVWGTLFGICITLLSIVILFLLFKANLDDLLGLVRQISFLPLLVTLPVYILVLYGSSLAWSRIMNDLRVKLPSRQHQLIYVVTNAAKRIPGSLWHVVGRVAWYNQLGISKRLTTLANVLEYVLVLLSGMVLSLFLFPTVTRLQAGAILLFCAGILVSAILLNPRLLVAVLKRLGQELPGDDLRYKTVVFWLLRYIPIWLGGGIILFFIIRSLYPITLSQFPACLAAWAIAGVSGLLILLLPSGFGLTEATLSLLLSTQIPSSIAVASALIMRILLTFYEFLFALLFYFLRNRIIPPPLPHEVNPENPD